MKLYIADIACLMDEKKYDRYLHLVNERRRAKVLRCKNAEDGKRILLAGVLLRRALEDVGVDYEKADFAVTEEGKPYLRNPKGIFFSLSHAGKYAVCLIADSNVGVDVECANRKLLKEADDKRRRMVAERLFTPQEWTQYAQIPKDKQGEFFLKIWTRKEAVSKAEGKGLRMDFSKINEQEEKFCSFWLEEGYYISIYRKEDRLRKEDIEICMMN